jgi:hypothetical protein
MCPVCLTVAACVAGCTKLLTSNDKSEDNKALIDKES